MAATQSRLHIGRNGAISGTASAISVAAGLVTLQNGGNAADAATAIAMTGITTQLGSVVSYAGIMSLVYFEAKTGKIYSLEGGYNSRRPRPSKDLNCASERHPGLGSVSADRSEGKPHVEPPEGGGEAAS